MSRHEEAFNVARRLSARVEPDFLQEDMMSSQEEESFGSSPPASPYTKKYCFSMLDKVCPQSPLPSECKQFEDVVVALQRRNSDRSNHAIAFQGMYPGAASAAMVARERGELNHAQIQRRLTSSSR